MKKLTLTTAILLGLATTVLADPNGGGLFQRGTSPEMEGMYGNRSTNTPMLPSHGSSENQKKCQRTALGQRHRGVARPWRGLPLGQETQARITFPFHNLLTRADSASCRLSFHKQQQINLSSDISSYFCRLK